MNTRLWLTYCWLCAAPFLLAGCGRPPPTGGPPSEFSVLAVVAPVAEEPLRATLQVVGTLRAPHDIEIVSEISATVRDVLFIEGEDVAAGQLLVRLDDVKLQARATEASARFRLARTNLERRRELLASQTISQQEFDQAEAEFDAAEALMKLAEREKQDAQILAPFAGKIGERRVSPGQWLTPGAPVTRLVQTDPMELEFRMPERHVDKIVMGQTVFIRAVGLPGAALEGQTFFMDPVVDETSRTVLVKARLANPDSRLKPGMFGQVDVVIAERERALILPDAAIRFRGDQAYVVVVNEEQRAEFRDVTVGHRMEERAEITAGLVAGERIVVEGFQKMGPGTAIDISPASARYGITPPPAPES
ncbi:MAG TPA: efflux RND transporter periplasmic adaptor subunit [Kiritimatiellia bacterium]|nr:efflux RND transporter periplasmic adaptor subunit [Kiritimatiellia bacterium]HMO98767.1 efflux RND transporter periplasmic adaptor subunit [Kiritimatiellia bacterium]HMP97720.1 efflux RND transporter periplasmic adaptor subunit [Kiritimatiellia bacterium]